MNALEHVEKIREYCDYLERHLVNVDKSWKVLTDTCGHLKFIQDDYLFHSIAQLIREHDLSKVSKEEFIPYCERFFPVGESDCPDFEGAWEHHKENNPHHSQNWTAREFRNPDEWQCHCVCMVVDWMAMGLEFGNTAQEYYESHPKIKLPGYSVALIYDIFKALQKEK